MRRSLAARAHAVGMVALVEAPQPLGHLRPVEQPVEALGLDPQPLVEGAAEAARRGLLVGVDRRLRQRRDRVRQLACPLAAGPARHDLVDEPDPLRLARVDHAAGDDQLHRDAEADDPRQPLRAAVAEADVPAPAGDAERGVLVGDAEVGPAGPLQPARVGDAVDGGDRRLVQAGPARRAEDPRPLSARVGGSLLRRDGDDDVARERVLEVAAGAEGVLAGAGQHPHERGVVVAEARPGVEQLAREHRPDRVHALRPVDRDHGHRAVLLVAEMFVVHGGG
jgi:hypothetical protein